MSSNVPVSGDLSAAPTAASGSESGPRTLYLAYMSLPINPATGRAMTKAAAAALAGVDKRTVTRWEQDAGFRAAVAKAQNAGVEDHRATARAGGAALLASAIYVYAELLRDPQAPATVRAQLAIKILELMGASVVDVPGPAGSDVWAGLLSRLAVTPPPGQDDEE